MALVDLNPFPITAVKKQLQGGIRCCSVAANGIVVLSGTLSLSNSRLQGLCGCLCRASLEVTACTSLPAAS